MLMKQDKILLINKWTMKKLTGKELLNAQKRLSALMKVSNEQYETKLVKKDNLLAVPILAKLGYTNSYYEGILKAAQVSKDSEITAFWLHMAEADAERAFCISFRVTTEEIEPLAKKELRTSLPAASGVTFSGNLEPNWLYFHAATDGNDYDVLVGTEEIIQIFTGLKPEETFHIFDKQVDEIAETQPPRESDRLVQLSQDLKMYNNSSPGIEVVIE